VSAAKVGSSVAEWGDRAYVRLAGAWVEIVFVGIRLCDTLKNTGRANRALGRKRTVATRSPLDNRGPARPFCHRLAFT
jgi:hypothetical protein